MKKEGPLNPVLQNQLKRRVWKEGLQLTLPLQGVKFNGCNAACLAPWNLSLGDWAYVARQIDLVLKVGDEDEGLLLCRELLPMVATYVFLSTSFFVRPVGGYTKSSEGNAPGFKAASSFVEE